MYVKMISTFGSDFFFLGKHVGYLANLKDYHIFASFFKHLVIEA